MVASMGLGSQMLFWGFQCSGPRSFPPSNRLQGGAALWRSLLLLCPGLEAKMGSVETCLGARSSEGSGVCTDGPTARRSPLRGQEGGGPPPAPRQEVRAGRLEPGRVGSALCTPVCEVDRESRPT